MNERDPGYNAPCLLHRIVQGSHAGIVSRHQLGAVLKEELAELLCLR